MAVEWGLAGRGGQFNYLDSLQQIGNAQAQQQAIGLAQQRADQQAYLFQQQQRQDAQRVKLADRARAGDYAGARQEAALGGDFQFAEALGGLRQDQLQQLNREFDVIGRLHPTLKALPVEQRAQTALPLLKQAGFTDAELAGVDWSDAGLDGAYQLSEAGKAALKAQLERQTEMEKPRVVGTDLVDGSGRLIYQGAKEADWIWDSDGGNWLQKPGTGRQGYSSAAPSGGASGGPVSGRTQYGWTPRQRNGGDNSDAAVDGKIAGMARALGVSPDQDLSGLSDTQIAQALTLSEGGRGSVADRNNNPGNLRDPRTGAYRRFGTKEEGLAAAAAQVRRNRARGQNTIRTMVEGLPVGGGARGGGGQAQQQPGVINVRPPKERGNTRRSEAEFRKEFNALPEVKEFNKVRPQFNTLRDLARKENPTAQDDIAIIFNYMKLLDPSSVVREGEFATAQNAAGIPDQIRNLYDRALKGTRLNPDQRRNLLETGYRYYQNYRQSYNTQAEQYRSYAKDNDVNPDRVARTYTPDRPQRRQSRLNVGQTFNGGGIKITRVQ